MGTGTPTYTRNTQSEGGGRATTDGSRGRRGQNGRGDRRQRDERFANALGWVSIGLALAELVAPRRVARMIGVDDDGRNLTLLRMLGLRELSSGVGILAQPHPTGWVWSRVVGDAMDLALLGSAMASSGTRRGKTAAVTGAVLGITALDILCAARMTGRNGASADGVDDGSIRVRRGITINRPPDEVYRYWRDFQNLPRFMQHLEEVQVRDERRSRWKAKAPAGATVEWDAEIVEDRPGELISWRSVGDTRVENAGSVQFAPAPGDRGTEVLVDLSYDPPGGEAGAVIAKLFREEPGQQVEDDLRRLKQVLETGEVLLSDASAFPGPHPAQPSRTGPPIRPRYRMAGTTR